MPEAFICDGMRTPIGRYGGALAKVRTDDLAAVPIKSLMARYPGVDWSRLDEVYLGCANQAGEDNRNVARMALLLAGLPVTVPGQTVNRLCGSGLQAINAAAQAIWSGQGDVFIAGGVESMTRAPLVMLKPEAAYFFPEHGLRGAMMFFDMKDASEIPAIAEPLFAGLNARIQLLPVMNADDLKKGLDIARQAM